MNISQRIAAKIVANRVKKEEMEENQQKFIIMPNPDFLFRKEVEQAIKDNGGYCCCALEKTPDTKCICKAFKEQDHCGFCQCRQYYKYKRAPIITLCGSTRFKEAFLKAQRDFTLAGYVVLTVGVFGHTEESEEIIEQAKGSLDELHKTKIAMSDFVYVINVGGYIGESTKSEIEWAQELGKEILYLEE